MLKYELVLIFAGAVRYYFDIDKFQSLSYIHFINRYISDNELVAMIINSSFVVCPYTDATQSGVVMTAFTFNKPVVATNVGALPEVVIDNRYGLIVEEKNEDSFANGIMKLLGDEKLLKKFESNISMDYCNGEKSWGEIAKKIVQVYKSIKISNRK